MRWPKSLRWRYSLRALFVLVTLFSIWGGYHSHLARRERQGEELLKAMGANVQYATPASVSGVLGLYRRISQFWGETYITTVSVVALDEETVTGLLLLPHLKRLDAHFSPSVPGSVARLLSGAQLRYVDLTGCSLSREDYAALASHPSLLGIDVSSTDMTDGDLQKILTLSHLTDIRFSRTKATGRGLTQVPPSATLESVECNGTTPSHELARFLAGCPRLRHVRASNSTVSDSFVCSLGRHPSIEELSLPHCPISDLAVRHIETMPNIRYVAIYGAGTVSLQAIERLAKKRPGLVIR